MLEAHAHLSHQHMHLSKDVVTTSDHQSSSARHKLLLRHVHNANRRSRHIVQWQRQLRNQLPEEQVAKQTPAPP